jgi:hypothetical protein
MYDQTLLVRAPEPQHAAQRLAALGESSAQGRVILDLHGILPSSALLLATLPPLPPVTHTTDHQAAMHAHY